MMHIHDLKGCAPMPLAHYLKALGILRLVSEQADPDARGWWHGDVFRLATKMDRAELEAFFLERYEPTPIFNPWGARSGFYSGSSESTARKVLMAIEQADESQLTAYKESLKTVRSAIKTFSNDRKPESQEKDTLILGLRRHVRGQSLHWMDSVAAVIGSGDSISIKHPALFGTGGNEGSGSYTSAYMHALDQCLIKKKWNHAVSNAIFGENTVPDCNFNQNMGQFLPEGTSTPWDLILAFEGACMVRSAVASRNDKDDVKWMSSPFFMAPTAYGYITGTRIDEYKLSQNTELPGQGEQWFPLWSQPILYSELAKIFIDGRVLTKRGKAKDGWSMLCSITSRGVHQGIREFVRYGYLQRNNLASHLAVPLGRYRVPQKTQPILSCLDDLDKNNWLVQLRHAARDKKSTTRLTLSDRVLGNELFAVSQQPANPNLWQNVLLSMAKIEEIMATGSGFKAGPVPALRPEWVQAAHDGSAEFRLALVFALQADFESKPSDGIRRHWLPLDGKWFAKSGTGAQARLEKKPDVVLTGRNGIDDAIALVRRRLIEAGQKGQRHLTLAPDMKAAASPADLALLLSGGVDLDRVLSLGCALMAIDRRQWAKRPCPSPKLKSTDYPDDAWLAIRLSLLPWALPDGRAIGMDPAIFRRLESGDAASAFTLARRRLRAAGIGTTVRCAVVSPEIARLWAAALAFPIARKTAEQFVRRLDPNAT